MTTDKIAKIWCRELKLDTIAPDDDFFMMGGHSLIMARIQTEILDQFGIEVPMDELFRKSTIAAISAYVDSRVVSPA